MSLSQATAQAKSAAWALVAIVGIHRACEILSGIIAELRDSEWQSPGNR